MSEPLLRVEHLTTVFDTAGGAVPAVDEEIGRAHV